MKKIFLLILLGSSLSLYAQGPEEGLRLSWFAPNGTARSNALGGAMGSLGGDLSSSHINPAGLGFYKSSEFLLTPRYLVQNNKTSYLGTDKNSEDNKLKFGSIGFVLADGMKKRNWTSTAFSITFNQIADYNNQVRLSGVNNFSSYSEKFLEELVNDGADTLAALDNYIFGSSLAFRTYLVDTTAGANGAVTGYQSLVPLSTGVNQVYDARTRGSYNELAFGWGGNKQDQLYLGASIVMPFMNYERQISYSETDMLNNPNNQFGGFIFNEYFSSKAWGLGAKFGVIYKPVSYLRLGFAIQTPQIITFRDQISADMTTNTEDYAGLNSASSDQLNNGFPGLREYTMATPTRVTLSTSYFFASPNKPAQPLGFISADLEIVNYAGTRYFSNTYDDASTQYYNALNSTIKAVYKNNVNLKLGSELRLNTNWMVRAGTAFYGSPYKDESIKASIWTLSGGLGYRTSRHFIDFTVVNTRTKDAIFPYRLNDKPNTYANFTGNRLQFSIGFGIRF